MQDVNHAVLAVGYGVENGTPYWLIKNSWGADWGVDGYFKMELGKNMCGKCPGYRTCSKKKFEHQQQNAFSTLFNLATSDSLNCVHRIFIGL